jgi:hypothetical protein
MQSRPDRRSDKKLKRYRGRLSMTDENETSILEKPVVHVMDFADAGFLLPVVDLVKLTAPRLWALGFFFDGILPELRDGDVLRLQFLNKVEVERDDVCTASDVSEELLNIVFEQREALD